MPSSATATNLFAIFTDRLEQIGVRYMVTGSVAGMRIEVINAATLSI